MVVTGNNLTPAQLNVFGKIAQQLAQVQAWANMLNPPQFAGLPSVPPSKIDQVTQTLMPLTQTEIQAIMTSIANAVTLIQNLLGTL